MSEDNGTDKINKTDKTMWIPYFYLAPPPKDVIVISYGIGRIHRIHGWPHGNPVVANIVGLRCETCAEPNHDSSRCECILCSISNTKRIEIEFRKPCDLLITPVLPIKSDLPSSFEWVADLQKSTKQLKATEYLGELSVSERRQKTSEIVEQCKKFLSIRYPDKYNPENFVGLSLCSDGLLCIVPDNIPIETVIPVEVNGVQLNLECDYIHQFA